MTNFNDFETVLAAANEELNNLKKKSKEIQNEIDIIDQDRYKVVYEYFDNLAKMLKRNNIDTNTLFIPTSMPTAYGDYFIFRIALMSEEYTVNSYHDTVIVAPELAVHTSKTMDNYYDYSLGSRDKQYGWIRWMRLHPTYKDALDSAKGKYGSFSTNLEDVLNYFVDHFEEIEPEFSANVKEAITRQMAHKLQETESEVRNKVTTLINK